MLLQASGIYRITCLPTGKNYIGSAVNMYRRWHARHLPQLRRGTHVNRYLQAAWRKYGEKAFRCGHLETVATSQLVRREQHWINWFDSANPKRGFNLSPTAGSSLGTKHTRRTKQKIRKLKAKAYIVRSPDCKERRVVGLYRFCRARGLSQTVMSRVARGKATHHKGWHCRYADVTLRAWREGYTGALPRQARRRGMDFHCGKCRTYKPKSAFDRDRTVRYGVAAYCKECKREVNQRRKRGAA